MDKKEKKEKKGRGKEKGEGKRKNSRGAERGVVSVHAERAGSFRRKSELGPITRVLLDCRIKDRWLEWLNSRKSISPPIGGKVCTDAAKSFYDAASSAINWQTIGIEIGAS